MGKPPALPENNSIYLVENKDFMTASKLKIFIKCPYTFHLMYNLGLLLEEDDKVYFVVGSAADDFCSYGLEYYQNKYEVLEKYKKKSQFSDKIQINYSDGHCLNHVIDEMRRQPLFELHNPRFKCQKEIIAEFEGVKLRATLDRIDPKTFEVRDTKTIRHTDDGKQFYNRVMYAIHDFGYDFSMAFYTGLANQAQPGEWKAILEFFSKGIDHSKFMQVEIPQEVLEEKRVEIFGQEGVGGAIRFYKQCVENNYFPTHSELYPFDYSYLNSPFYKHNPGALQKTAFVFQDFSHDIHNY